MDGRYWGCIRTDELLEWVAHFYMVLLQKYTQNKQIYN